MQMESSIIKRSFIFFFSFSLLLSTTHTLPEDLTWDTIFKTMVIAAAGSLVTVSITEGVRYISLQAQKAENEKREAQKEEQRQKQKAQKRQDKIQRLEFLKEAHEAKLKKSEEKQTQKQFELQQKQLELRIIQANTIKAHFPDDEEMDTFAKSLLRNVPL